MAKSYQRRNKPRKEAYIETWDTSEIASWALTPISLSYYWRQRETLKCLIMSYRVWFDLRMLPGARCGGRSSSPLRTASRRARPIELCVGIKTTAAPTAAVTDTPQMMMTFCFVDISFIVGRIPQFSRRNLVYYMKRRTSSNSYLELFTIEYRHINLWCYNRS